MYPLIVCYCGREIGCLYPLYSELRRRKIFAELGDVDIDPDVAIFTPELQVEMGDILDQLNLKLQCCRARMLTQVPFYDVYGR
jgi:DNA-directed RNA polymerase subunit N (RpoN/RPB10)